MDAAEVLLRRCEPTFEYVVLVAVMLVPLVVVVNVEDDCASDEMAATSSAPEDGNRVRCALRSLTPPAPPSEALKLTVIAWP